MNFYLSYSGSLGNVTAELFADGKLIETAYELKNGSEAKSWAKRAAKQHKKAQTQPKADNHTTAVTISYSGRSAFSL